MPERLEWMDRVIGGLLKSRWLVMALIGLVATLLDIYEHYQNHALQLNIGFLSEIVFEGLLLPLFGGLLLSLLYRVSADRYFLIKYLAYKSELSRQINNAPELNELIKVIAEYPRNIVPIIGSDLVIYDTTLGRSETRVAWSDQKTALPARPHPGSWAYCTACAASNLNSGPLRCSFDKEAETLTQTTRYCLPLAHAHLLVALLHLYFLPDVTLTSDQQNIFKALAPDMAVAIDATRNRRLNVILKERADAEHRQLVRELHDNLAHGLMDLRYQFDQLIAGEATEEIPLLQSRLNQIREGIEDVYVDLRSTLKDLEASSSAELLESLQEYISVVQNQVSYRIEFENQGQPQPVPARTVLHIMYIMREVLSNIEKHANATRVDVQLQWHPDGLHLSIVDDGSGFDPGLATENGHMGLRIVRERAEDIQGKLAVNSAIGVGTKVTLWLPLLENSE